MTTKNELIAAIANRIVEKKSTVEHVFNSALAEIERSLLAGKSVTLHGFGTFEIKKRDARTGRNPRTGEPVEIAASNHRCIQARQGAQGLAELTQSRKQLPKSKPSALDFHQPALTRRAFLWSKQ